MQREYVFPVKDPFEAAEVTTPKFFIQSRKDWFKALHVDFPQQPTHPDIPLAVRVDAITLPLFRELITRRVDAGLFADGVLEHFIEMSGGSPHILLKLINHSIVSALGEQVTMDIAREVTLIEANKRWRTFTARHKERLRSGDFNDMDKETLELLQSLNVLEYNGLSPERRINPLIARFFKDSSAS